MRTSIVGPTIATLLLMTPLASAQHVSHAHDAPNAVVPAWWDVNNSDALLERMQQAAAGNPQLAARNISAVLLHGAEPRVAAFGLHALAALARPEGTLAVQRFLEHRRPTLRRHAIAAAVAIGGNELAQAVELRVGDTDADVRGDAAMALGEMNGRSGLPTLWTALDRDLDASLHPEGTALIRGCAHSIARLGEQGDIERLLGYLRRAPLRSLTEAFDIALHRDLSEGLRVRIINQIGGLATADAREFLLRIAGEFRSTPAPWVELARTNAARIQVPGGGT